MNTAVPETPKQRAARRERELDRLIFDAYCDAGGPNRDGNRISDYSTLPDWPTIAAEVVDLANLLDDYGNTGEIPALEPLLVAIVAGKPLTEELLAPVRDKLRSIAEDFIERYERTHDFEDRHDAMGAAAHVDDQIDERQARERVA